MIGLLDLLLCTSVSPRYCSLWSWASRSAGGEDDIMDIRKTLTELHQERERLTEALAVWSEFPQAAAGVAVDHRLG